MNMKDLFNLVTGKSEKRIPGNIRKRMRGRVFRVPSGFTIARPSTREYRRIIAVSKGIILSTHPTYGSKKHLKWLKKLIVTAKLLQLKSEGARVV